MARPGVIVIAALLALIAAPAMSQARGQAPAGPTVAEEGSAYYGFEHLSVPSRDGARLYRVRIATPKKAPPAQGLSLIHI